VGSWSSTNSVLTGFLTKNKVVQVKYRLVQRGELVSIDSVIL